MSEELLRVALAEHAAAQERPYFEEESDGAAAEQYYAGVEPDFDPLSQLLVSTHREQPHYSPAVELYPWVDLQPDGKIRSLYTGEEFEPEFARIGAHAGVGVFMSDTLRQCGIGEPLQRRAAHAGVGIRAGNTGKTSEKFCIVVFGDARASQGRFLGLPARLVEKS